MCSCDPGLIDPLQGKTIDNFHHVTHNLSLDEDVDKDNSSIKNMSEDVKRALGALQTSEAAQAMAAGGGGKRMEAQRALAEAKAMKSSASDSKAAAKKDGAAASTTATEPSTATASAAGDWRLRAPGPESRPQVSSKPGALTWDTDDYMDPKVQKTQRQLAKLQPDSAAGPGPSTLTPQQWYEQQVT